MDLNKDGNLGIDDFEILAEKVSDHLGNSKKEVALRNGIFDKSRTFYNKLNGEIHSDIGSFDVNEWLGYFDKEVIGGEDDVTLDEVVQLFLAFIFGVFDENHDGYVSLSEYEDLFEVFGISKEHSREAYSHLDLNSDGLLSRYELLVSIETFIISDDEQEAGNWIFGNWELMTD